MIKKHWYKLKDSSMWEYHGKFDYYYELKTKELKVVNKGKNIIIKKIEFKEARRDVEQYEEKKSTDRL